MAAVEQCLVRIVGKKSPRDGTSVQKQPKTAARFSGIYRMGVFSITTTPRRSSKIPCLLRPPRVTYSTTMYLDKPPTLGSAPSDSESQMHGSSLNPRHNQQRAQSNTQHHRSHLRRGRKNSGTGWCILLRLPSYPHAEY